MGLTCLTSTKNNSNFNKYPEFTQKPYLQRVSLPETRKYIDVICLRPLSNQKSTLHRPPLTFVPVPHAISQLAAECVCWSCDVRWQAVVRAGEPCWFTGQASSHHRATLSSFQSSLSAPKLCIQEMATLNPVSPSIASTKLGR